MLRFHQSSTHTGVHSISSEGSLVFDKRDDSVFALDAQVLFRFMKSVQQMMVEATDYVGLNLFGGPVEKVGRFRYIDGCSDSLLIPPVRKGDPCLNHLHFPAGIRQTPHTHPSVRTGLVLRGSGECIVPATDAIPLRPGNIFIIPTNSTHSFNTSANTMDVIAFHPDSDAGMTDDDHPMINRTIVDGVSARYIDSIRT